jgi:hypothetical protein
MTGGGTMFRQTLRSSLAAAALLACIALITAADTSAQTRQTKQVMRQKLLHSEALLAALVTSNWNSLDRNSKALDALTMQPGWQVLRLPEYNKYTNAFQRATDALVTAAGGRDTEGAVSAYNSLVGSCVGCHRYVSRARIARTTPAP